MKKQDDAQVRLPRKEKIDYISEKIAEYKQSHENNPDTSIKPDIQGIAEETNYGKGEI